MGSSGTDAAAVAQIVSSHLQALEEQARSEQSRVTMLVEFLSKLPDTALDPAPTLTPPPSTPTMTSEPKFLTILTSPPQPGLPTRLPSVGSTGPASTLGAAAVPQPPPPPPPPPPPSVPPPPSSGSVPSAPGSMATPVAPATPVSGSISRASAPMPELAGAPPSYYGFPVGFGAPPYGPFVGWPAAAPPYMLSGAGASASSAVAPSGYGGGLGVGPTPVYAWPSHPGAPPSASMPGSGSVAGFVPYGYPGIPGSGGTSMPVYAMPPPAAAAAGAGMAASGPVPMPVPAHLTEIRTSAQGGPAGRDPGDAAPKADCRFKGDCRMLLRVMSGRANDSDLAHVRLFKHPPG